MVLRLVDGICFHDNGCLKFKDDEQVGGLGSTTRLAHDNLVPDILNHPHLALPHGRFGDDLLGNIKML